MSALNIPKIEVDVGLWIHLLESRMALSAIVGEYDVVRKFLLKQLRNLGWSGNEEGLDIGSTILLALAEVKRKYPIHFGFLADLSAFLTIVVVIFHGASRGAEIKRQLEQMGLNADHSVYTHKVRVYAQHCFYGGFIKSAASLFEELLEEESAFWEIWLCRGAAATMGGKLEEAEQYLLKAIKHAESSLGRSNSYALCVCFYANCLLMSRQYIEAERKYLEALTICHQNRNYAGLVRVLHDLACLYRVQGAFERSTQIMESCLKRLHLVQGRDRHREQAMVYFALSVDHYLQDRHELATCFHMKCVRYYLDWNIGAGIPARDHMTRMKTAEELWLSLTGCRAEDKHTVDYMEYTRLVLFHAYPSYRDTEFDQYCHVINKRIT